MKRFLAVMLALVACCFALMATAPSDAAVPDLMLFEVNPFNDDEGVSLHNYGSATISLSEYSVTDNPDKTSSEGIVTFDASLTISPGETLTFVKSIDDDSYFSYRYTTYVGGDGNVTFSKGFNLANTGDDVYLFKGDTVIDTFVYGNAKAPEGGLWKGDAFTIQSDCFAARKSADGFSASCWYSYLPGGTNIPFDPDLRFNASVTPFLFPESGGIPVYDALEDAKSSVYITIYMLSSSNVVGLLKELADRGISINLLLEASPLGSYKPVTDGRLKTLSDAGADIKLIGNSETSRYSYVHAKYCIIDDSKVIITSENWTKDNMNGTTVTDPTEGEGNRGWGAIVESPEYASFMMNVYRNDADVSYGDVKDFDDATPGLKPVKVDYSSPTETYPVKTYRTDVTPGLSPDSSYDAEIHYISEATERIFSEQQSLTKTYIDFTKESPLKYLNQKASMGTDVRVVFSDNVDIEIIDEINATSQIKAAQMADPYTHNKGVICDDTVIIASVNWTKTSFFDNRESMVIVHSGDVADYFAKAFEEDFERNYRGSGLTVTFTEIQPHYDAPGDYTVSVEVKQSGSFAYSWDLDGSVRTTSVPRALFGFEAGDHSITVTVTDADGTTGKASYSFTVDGSGGKGGILDDYKQYIVPVLLILFAVLVAVIRLTRGKR